MDRQDPLSLLDLATQSLLSDEDSAVRALEELPVVLFPVLSTAAFTGGHMKTVKALVQAWPFPCLHLGSLKDQSVTQDLLEAVLDGLEFVPSKTACPSLVEILGTLELESIREVRLHHRSRFCLESDIIQFFTQVGQMSNLGNFIMSDLPWDFPADCFSLLSPLGRLQKLHLIFGCLSGQLHKMLSGLQKPLETLVINGCRLTENDITYLSQSVHATRLKELVLCSNNLSQMVPGPLEILLGEVSGTLQHLNLRSCRLKESQLKALLPALCSCSRLRSLVFYDNVISTSGIMKVLQHLAGLMELKRVQYPVPAECVVYLDEYRWGNLNRTELARVHTKLQEMLQALQRADMQLTNSTSVA